MTEQTVQAMADAIFAKWRSERDIREGDGANAYTTALVAYEAAVEDGMVPRDELEDFVTRLSNAWHKKLEVEVNRLRGRVQELEDGIREAGHYEWCGSKGTDKPCYQCPRGLLDEEETHE